MKFGILGYGYVGKATHKGLLKDQKAIVYDITFSMDKKEIYKSDIVFICIPTNTYKDIDIIIKEIKEIKEHNTDIIVVVRSTLPLGACKKIQQEVGDIIYIPEFLRERYWDTDCLKRPLIVGSDTQSLLPEFLLEEEIYKCTTHEAELVKMFSNNYAVMRIAFANTFYELSQKVGADYDVVKDMFLQLKNEQSYMDIPGHDGTRGFGGKCLPKDLDFLIDALEDANIDHSWFSKIREANKVWVKKS